MTWKKIWSWYWSWGFVMYAITYFAIVSFVTHLGYAYWLAVLLAVVVDLVRFVAWETFKMWRSMR